jgi:ribosome-interacting GTPase 1
MPANLSPEYKKAEQAFRAAPDDRERLSCLREMLRTIPKHKGTEHLQADIKSRIKSLTEALSGPKKGAARSGPVHSIRPEGAAQIVMVGPPNSGKSSLHKALTGSRAAVGPYPHTTHEPMAGMCPYEDVNLQLVDLPPLSPDFVPSWLVSGLQPADAALLVVDIADPECPDQVQFVLEALGDRKVSLTPDWPDRAEVSEPGSNDARGGSDEARDTGDVESDPFRIRLPTLLVANKADLAGGRDDVEVLKELTGLELPALSVSVETGAGLEAIAKFLFDGLGIVRVYTKTPGKPPEMDKPFTLRHGDTVLDVARLVHKEIAGSLRYARAWGSGVFDGQQVGPEHPVADCDVLELHMH